MPQSIQDTGMPGGSGFRSFRNTGLRPQVDVLNSGYCRNPLPIRGHRKSSSSSASLSSKNIIKRQLPFEPFTFVAHAHFKKALRGRCGWCLHRKRDLPHCAMQLGEGLATAHQMQNVLGGWLSLLWMFLWGCWASHEQRRTNFHCIYIDISI